jgi:hypothetical protein
MRDDIDICDRTLGGNKFQECFLGNDAVAWIMKRTGSKVSFAPGFDTVVLVLVLVLLY